MHPQLRLRKEKNRFERQKYIDTIYMYLYMEQK